MPSSGLLGRRKASLSFASGGKAGASTTATGSAGGNAGSSVSVSNGSSAHKGSSRGIKLTLENDEDDELETGELEHDGIKVNRHSRPPASGHQSHSSSGNELPMLGAGSRSKILHQLGQPADISPYSITPPTSAQQMSHGPVIHASKSTSSLNGPASSSPPLATPGGPPKPRHFRKASFQNKLSLTGLKDVVTSSPVTTPSHITGVLDHHTYFDFPSVRPTPASPQPPTHLPNPSSSSRPSGAIGSIVTANSNDSKHGGASSSSSSGFGSAHLHSPPLTVHQGGVQYATMQDPETAPPAHSTGLFGRHRRSSKSGSSVSLNVVASPPGRQRSAPAGVQTFNVGLPPADASARPPYGTSTLPKTHTKGSLSRQYSDLKALGNPSEPFPSGLVTARSASFPDLDGSIERDAGASISPWPASASHSNRIVSPDITADDGQLEEIVPWLYQGADGKRPTSPISFSFTSSPASPTRQSSPPVPSGSHRQSVGQILRSSKSTSNVRQSSDRSQSAGSIEVPRERKQSNRFMGMLRKKSTAFVDAVSSSSTRERDDNTLAAPSNSTSAAAAAANRARRMSPREEELYSGRGVKKSKKDKKSSKDAPMLPARPATTGISLDTNLDQMEGIVDLNRNTFPTSYSMSNPYEHLNAVTAAHGSPRPGTPPSPSQIPTLRRPSIGATSKKYEFITSDAQDPSPLSKRLGLSRKQSMDIQASLQKWPMAGSGPLTGPSPAFTEGARKGSLASLLNDRRGSEGTINGIPSAADAGWTAPDSWAVKPSVNNAKDEDSDDDDPRIKQDTVAAGSLPATPLLNGDPSDMPSTSTAVIPAIKASNGHRPGTAGSTRPAMALNLKPLATMAAVRIHKVDGSHTIISLPYSTTVEEFQVAIWKKPGFVPSNSKIPAKSYKLYIRAKGLERLMAPKERPLQWQDRKLRSAGYDPDSDKLEELGREDQSYLCKFIFKPETVPLVRLEEENIESFEYIDLASRGIENLPVFLHKHAHEIISLNISRNSHLHLPTDFVQACTSLRDLKMVEMGMKRIPQSVREVPGLTRLDISVNRIIELEHCCLDQNKELTMLNALNNRLTSLPDYFVHFKALKYLNLSNNRFEIFPVVICEVASLVDLDISFNSLSSLPPEIGKLKNLESLILVCNNIATLPSTIAMLPKLRELDCRRNRIADFSPISSMPSLQTVRAQHNMAKALELHPGSLAVLNLSNNPITRFTVAGGTDVSALTHLDISNTRLETIPEELFVSCTQLQVLAINDNKIRFLSEAVGDLQRLGRLSINNNALQALPASISKLQRLHTLEASNNKLTTLPSVIWQCSEIVNLNFSSNSIVEFPDPSLPTPGDAGEDQDRKFSSASGPRQAPPLSMSLKRLHLAYNRLRDDVFRPLSLFAGLGVLNLSFNDIYEIPSGLLQKCYQLTHLYLSGNMLTSLPADDLERLINLRVLHLNGNKLQTLPAELGSIQTLQVLDVGSNALKYNIANWPYDWNWNWNLQLRYLNLSGNKRLEIKPSNQHAQEISPNGMPIKRRNLSDFSALSHLRVLGLMDVTLMIPSVPDETDSRRVRTSLSSINEMGYGVADTLGASDHLSMIDLVVPRFRGKDDECVVGLFDCGLQDKAGGAKIVKFIVDQFVQRLTLELSRLRDEDASQGLRRTFLSLNRDWGNSVTLDYDRARKESDVLGQGDRFVNGCHSSQTSVQAVASAVVVYIYKKTLYVANVGDSMALIAGRTMLARDMTTKHEAYAPEEVYRIRSAEGWISARGLVNDVTEHARGFGAFHVFPAVSCEPAVHVLDMVDSDEFVIIANRGLWSVLTSQMAVDVAWEHKGDPMLAAQKLRDLAIAYGADANIMVMVINVADLYKSKQPIIRRGLAVPSAEPDNFYDSKPLIRRPQGSIPGLRVADETVAPQGTVALVFTDIRNSTALWETNPGMQNAMRIHHELLRRLIRAFDGYEVKTEGDAFMVSFSSVTSAVLWAFTVQLELLRADWPVELLMSEEGKELYGPQGELVYRGLSVRMGLHWGAPICEQDPVNHRMDYLGPMVNRAARISGVAEGGQVTASADAIEVLQAMLSAFNDNEDDKDNPLVDPNQLDAATKRDIASIRQLGCVINEIGEHKLKGLETPEFLSLIYPSALAGRLTGGNAKENVPGPNITASVLANVQAVTPALPPVLEHIDVSALAMLCLRLEALSVGQNHHFYETSSQHTTSASRSPSIGYTTSSAAPRRRVILSPHLLSTVSVRPEASEEELLVLLESFIVRIENALSAVQLRQLGPFTDVLAALGDAVKIEPNLILQALTMLSQML